MPPVRAAIRNPRKLVPSAYYVYVPPKDLSVRELAEEQRKNAIEFDFSQRYGGEDEDSSDESSFVRLVYTCSPSVFFFLHNLP